MLRFSGYVLQFACFPVQAHLKDKGLLMLAADLSSAL
jgi:hypothetical protein